MIEETSSLRNRCGHKIDGSGTCPIDVQFIWVINKLATCVRYADVSCYNALFDARRSSSDAGNKLARLLCVCVVEFVEVVGNSACVCNF